MAADLLVVLLLVLMLEMLMVLLYKVVLMMLDPVLVLSSSVLYDVHRLQVLERVTVVRVGSAVEGGRLQEDHNQFRLIL